MDINSIIMTVLTIIVSGLTTWTIKSVNSNLKAFKTLKTAQRTMIKDRIVQAHDYFVAKGEIGKYSLSTLEDMYREYKALGGNSFVEELMNDIRGLRIK